MNKISAEKAFQAAMMECEGLELNSKTFEIINRKAANITMHINKWNKLVDDVNAGKRLSQEDKDFINWFKLMAMAY